MEKPRRGWSPPTALINTLKPGVKLHHLTVIEEVLRNKHQHRCFRFKCDCGEEIVAIGHMVLSGRTTSCGCYRKSVAGRNTFRYADPTQAAKNGIYTSYRYGAKTRKLTFTISKEEFIRLIQQPCYYCGQPLANVYYRYQLPRTMLYNGIDRKDNEKG